MLLFKARIFKVDYVCCTVFFEFSIFIGFLQISRWHIVFRSSAGSGYNLYDIWSQNGSFCNLSLNGTHWRRSLTNKNVSGVYKSNAVDRLWPAVKKVMKILIFMFEEVAAIVE